MDSSSRYRSLALEGERLCRSGDWEAGVKRLEAVLREGCTEDSTLCFVYSQLGSAYFYLKNYDRALYCHQRDVELLRRAEDRVGEAKAHGSVGNVLKAIGRFDEAAVAFQRQLQLARDEQDKVRESKALYSLGNVYHSKGKDAANGLQLDPGQYPDSVRTALQNAAAFYEASLQLVQELGDRVAEGRACGNLGSTHYLLGNFDHSIKYHKKRLEIAQEVRDYPAERRACTNLGNAHVFLCQFAAAADYYRKTLLLGIETKDRAVEAQACYSLGNTYTLLKDYIKATEYHLRHLEIARELGDSTGEARACWSLGNAYTVMGNYKQALSYAVTHYQLALKSNDVAGTLAAKKTLQDLKVILGIPQAASPVPMESDDPNPFQHEWDRETDSGINQVASSNGHDIEVLQTDDKKAISDVSSAHSENVQHAGLELSVCSPGGRVHVLVSKEDTLQQAASGAKPVAAAAAGAGAGAGAVGGKVSESGDSFIKLLSNNQNKRINDQRYQWPRATSREESFDSVGVAAHMDDGHQLEDIFDMLVRSQGNRFDDQRAPPPLTSGTTVPDEDFCNMIVRLQSQRLEDQRSSTLPRSTSSTLHQSSTLPSGHGYSQ